MELMRLTALELGKKIRNSEISVVEAVKAQLDIIKKNEPDYCCYITLLEEEALEQAKKIQRGIDRGEYKDSPLVGVPMAIKDNICTKNIRTTSASKMLENFIPTYDATVVEKLKLSGAVILGKTNMDEFAMGSTTESSYFGVTKNPWNTKYVPGGSSGGSAAAVAANEAFYTLGSDTGGSVRQPSSFCGVTGMKPTYGTVSRYGLLAYASSLDHIGPIARNISDAAAVLDIITGYDRKDSTSINREYGAYSKALIDDVKGVKIGIPKEYFNDGLEKEIKEKIFAAASVLKEKGAIIEEFDLESVRYAIHAYYVIASAEASSNLAKYDGIRYGYRTPEFQDLEEIYKKSRSEGIGEEAKLRTLLGAFVLSSNNYDTYYIKALKIRTLIKEGFNRAFSKYNVILGPTSPTTAYKLGKTSKKSAQKYSGDIYTVAANLCGLPAISIPCGLDKKGLPIGLQLIGNCFREQDILRVAYSYEREAETMGLMSN